MSGVLPVGVSLACGSSLRSPDGTALRLNDVLPICNTINLNDSLHVDVECITIALNQDYFVQIVFPWMFHHSLPNLGQFIKLNYCKYKMSESEKLRFIYLEKKIYRSSLSDIFFIPS